MFIVVQLQLSAFSPQLNFFLQFTLNTLNPEQNDSKNLDGLTVYDWLKAPEGQRLFYLNFNCKYLAQFLAQNLA